MSDIYKVEAILARRKIRGRPFCRVKWEGWEKPTWEPAEDIDGQRKTVDYPVPGKVYRVEAGSRIASVRGVQRHEGEIVAMVQYTDGIVPTRVIGEQDPQKIVDFYEQQLHVPDKRASKECGQDDESNPAPQSTNAADRLAGGSGESDAIAPEEEMGNASVFRRTISAVVGTLFGL